MVEITQADIVERLRTKYCCTTEDCNCDEAADTIERLRATIAALEQPTPELVSVALKAQNQTRWGAARSLKGDDVYQPTPQDAMKAALAAAAKHLQEPTQ